MTSADSTTSTPPTDAAAGETSLPASCHIVVMSAQKWSVARSADWTATSATLSADDLAAVKSEGATWRDAKYVARRVRQLRDERGWPGIVLVWALKNRLVTPPPPLAVPIEPLELNEGDLAIRMLAADPARAEPARESVAAVRAWRRFIARIGVGFIGFVNPAIQAIIGLAMRQWWQFYINLAITVIGLGVLIFVFWYTSGRWFIVPGGVIVRRGVLGKVAVRLARYTPGDTLLMVRPFPPSGWQAELWREKRVDSQRFTKTELSALLAAWQSPLTCPPLDLLDDLR